MFLFQIFYKIILESLFMSFQVLMAILRCRLSPTVELGEGKSSLHLRDENPKKEFVEITFKSQENLNGKSSLDNKKEKSRNDYIEIVFKSKEDLMKSPTKGFNTVAPVVDILDKSNIVSGNSKNNIKNHSPVSNISKPDIDHHNEGLDLPNNINSNPKENVNYKEIIKRNQSKQRIPRRKVVDDKCYIISSSLLPMVEIEKIMKEFEDKFSSIRHVYRKNLLGFTVCTPNAPAFDIMKSKYNLINIEEDKTYRITSLENDLKYLYDLDTNKSLDVRDFNGDFVMHNSLKQTQNVHISRQLRIPLHFFRIFNMGNLIFNNYVLDNLLFRLLGINHLISYLYSYKYSFTGNNVRITLLDTPICNNHRIVNSSLINGYGNSIGKGCILNVIDCFKCDGTIKLSELLNALETIDNTDILALPFSGPHSESLNLSLKRLSLRMIIVSSGGNNSDDGCNYSPSGNFLISVGSVNKYGNISGFSNKNGCINIYSLGEDVLNSNGTSYSTALVVGAVSAFLEAYPSSTLSQVLDFLLKTSTKNKNKHSIFQITDLSDFKRFRRPKYFYTFKEVLIYNFIILSIIFAILIGALIFIKRIRGTESFDSPIFKSLRDNRV